jgi:hypothetical protein
MQLDLVGLANILGGFSALAALIIGTIAAFVARDQIVANREAAALDAFLAYMRTVIDHCEFDEPDFAKLTQDEGTYTRYRRFVGYALTACERVLLYSRGQYYWRKTVRSHIRRHREYIKTDLFEGYIDHFSPEIQKLLIEARAEVGPSQSDPVA